MRTQSFADRSEPINEKVICAKLVISFHRQFCFTRTLYSLRFTMLTKALMIVAAALLLFSCHLEAGLVLPQHPSNSSELTLDMSRNPCDDHNPVQCLGGDRCCPLGYRYREYKDICYLNLTLYLTDTIYFVILIRCCALLALSMRNHTAVRTQDFFSKLVFLT